MVRQSAEGPLQRRYSAQAHSRFGAQEKQCFCSPLDGVGRVGLCKDSIRDLDNSGSTGPAGRHVGEDPEVVILSNTNTEQRLTQVILLQEAYGFQKLGAKRQVILI